MKRTYQQKNTVIALLFLAFTSLLSCQKDKVENNICDGNGQPVINSVSNVDRANITQGEYNQYVIIKGQNLCNLKKFQFNDIEIAIDQLYANNNELTVRIPNRAPGNLTNKILLETPAGSAAFDFKINIPPVTIKNIENEYAPVGTTMIMAGQSFDFGGYLKGEGKVFFGTIEATITKATVDSLYVTVPQGAAQGMVIKTIDKYGAEFSYQYPYKDRTNLVVNYDDKPTGTWARKNYIGTDAIPGVLDGNYAHFVEMPLRSNFAVDQFLKGRVNVPADVLANPANYVIKFEVATLLPLDKAGIRIYGDNLIAPSRFNAWTFTAARQLNTKAKWITQTISLQSAIGGTATMAARANNQIELYAVATAQTGFNIDISFDNWRIVEKSKY